MDDKLDAAFDRVISDYVETIERAPFLADWRTIRRIADILSPSDAEALLFAHLGSLVRLNELHEERSLKRTENATQARRNEPRDEIIMRLAKERFRRAGSKQRTSNAIANYIIADLNKELAEKGIAEIRAGTLRKYLNEHPGWGDSVEDIFAFVRR